MFGQVTGTVVDNEGLPIPGASVAAHNPQNEIIKGTTTNINGEFELILPDGKYQIKIGFIGFKEWAKPIIVVGGRAQALGTLQLQVSETTLEEVTVKTDGKIMEFKADKRVFNVSQDIGSQGSNASDILSNIPSVSVDVEGEVSLRGSSNVRILIDGKPSGLVGSDPAAALRLLQGSMIERIEVITNPSAKYDAEGEAGIINIVLKKDQKKGLNGTFEAHAGYPDNYGGSLGLNYRTGKFNFFVNGSANYRESPGGGFTNQNYFYTDTTFSLNTRRDHTRGGTSATLRMGSDYHFNANQTFTAAFLYSPSVGYNDALIRYQDFDADKVLRETSFRQDDETEEKRNLETDLKFVQRFKGKKHQWATSFKFRDNNDHEKSNIHENILWNEPHLYQKVENTEEEQNILAQTDYVRPLKKDKNIEVGAKANWRTLNNHYEVSEFDGLSTFEVLDSFTNQFNYHENIYAGYAIFNNKFKEKLSYQLGLRAEYSYISTELALDDYENVRDYFNLFPSAFFSYTIKKGSELQANYSRRISRPGFYSLLPFFSFSDSRNFYSGNPDLNPEFTDSYEIGYQKYWEKASLYSGLYYRHQTDVVTRIRLVDTEGNSRMFPINLGMRDAYGLELNLNYKIKKWWEINANANLFQANNTGTYQEVDYGRANFNSQGRFSSKFAIWKSDAQVSLNYRGKTKTAQGERLEMLSLDFGWSLDVLKDKATISFSAKDLFNTRKRRSYSAGTNFDNYSEFQWRQRQILLSFNYRLNQKKSKRPAGTPSGNSGGH